MEYFDTSSMESSLDAISSQLESVLSSMDKLQYSLDVFLTGFLFVLGVSVSVAVLVFLYRAIKQLF